MKSNGRLRKLQALSKLYEDIAQDSQTQYVVFVDLCGSTEYKQFVLDHDLPQSSWIHRQLLFLYGASEHFESKSATVVKSLGDGLLLTFDYTEAAETILNACVEFLRSLNSLKAFQGKAKMTAKVSLDFGETHNGAIRSNEYDPVGQCVDRCSRLNSKARANEICISDEFGNLVGIADKKSWHTAIVDYRECREDLKGLGAVSYTTLSIDLGPT
jgi:class 3 adenylate cyclase